MAVAIGLAENRRVRSKAQKVRRKLVVPFMGAPKTIGRPPAEVPSMLIDFALAHWLKTGRWSTVQQELKTAGFKPIARMTLQRRVLQRKNDLDAQNSDPCHY